MVSQAVASSETAHVQLCDTILVLTHRSTVDAVSQIQDKDVPILSHLVDIRVVNLRDEQQVSTSNKDDEDEDEEGPKVSFWPQ